MKKRKQPIEKLTTTYTVEMWRENGGGWEEQVIDFELKSAKGIMADKKLLFPSENFRIRKTVETVVGAA